MNGFKSQQFRWAKGSIQVARKLLWPLLRARIPLKVKIDGFFHLTQNVPYLLTLALVLVSVPALALRVGQPGDFLWLHLPTFVVTVLTLGIYCATSQRALRRSPWRALMHLPALVAVTVGICVNQSRAIIEGGLGWQSEFVRTPKHGLTDERALASKLTLRVAAWRLLRYRGARDLIPIAEVALALYMVVAASVLVLDDRLVGAPLFALLGVGFGYIGISSALRR